MNAATPSGTGPGSASPPPELAAGQDPRWQAVAGRDRAFDGRFVYSVRTTGVYCLPSCASRTANPANVRFHADAEAAERAGFRPCKRCEPNRPPALRRHAVLVSDACRFMREVETAPTLATLARRAGLSRHHFHRLFTAATGLTPRDYAAELRANRMRNALDDAPSVTDAIYAAGFGSGSRFYQRSNAILGMTPTRFRDGGRGERIRFAIGQCSLGAVLVAASDAGVCAILLGEDPDALLRDLQDRFRNADLVGADAGFESTVAVVVGLVEAPRSGHALPLDVRGTAFQQRVWQALAALPPGATASYAVIARAVGQPGASRAVARACAANPLAVAIPCHRVVRTDGALSGYRWGVARKRVLLEREVESMDAVRPDVADQPTTSIG